MKHALRLLPVIGMTLTACAAPPRQPMAEPVQAVEADTVEWRGVTMKRAALEDWESTALMGGTLRAAQAAYDVRHYDLEIAVYPEDKRIAGGNTIRVRTVMPMDIFEIPLDHRLQLGKVLVDGKSPATVTHENNLVRIAVPRGWKAGETHTVRIEYAGVPFEALAPPWRDGFVWSQSADGRPWIGTTSQGSGGDLWWPVKDHPSDEPDEGMNISLSVPAGLIGLTNGQKVGEREVAGRNVTEWRVHYPINQYAVAINVGPFVPIPARYKRLDGRDETIIFWSLPEHQEQARAMWLDQGSKILSAFAQRFGEYPFWQDKYWVVETPYLGMEHQTIVAYGNNFEVNEFGFDWLLLHETAHEWWGNKVSARDWADWWIHEGFGAYSHAVYVDVTAGKERYLKYMRSTCNAENFRKYKNPLIRGSDQTAEEAYVPEVYSKAACALHTLRWLMEDKDFNTLMYRFQNDRTFAYRTASTREFINLVASIEGKPYDWFFDRYFWRSDIPQWSMTRDGDTVRLAWDDPLFALPIPVSVNGELKRVDMTDGNGELDVPAEAKVEIDPQGWLLALPAEATIEAPVETSHDSGM